MVGDTVTNETDVGNDSAVDVLLVDDDETWARSTAQVLERQREGFDVRTATDLEAARAALSESELDCVVCDYGLKAGTGLDLLETVRERDPDRPFILITGQGSESVASDAIGKQVTDYIPKRLLGGRDDLLARRIESAVDTYRTRQALARERRSKEAILQILTAATSRAGLFEEFCDHLVAERDYECAWIGTLGGSREVVPRAVAGREAYVDEAIGPGASPAPRGEVALEALATREQCVVAPLSEDAEGWQATAREYGFGSATAVPLTHEGTTLGVLAVYRADPAVGAVKRELLGTYGSAIGYAMRSTEWRESLLSATPVAVNVELTDGSVPLVALDRNLPQTASTRVLTTGLRSETALYVVRIAGVDAPTVEAAAAATGAVEDATITATGDPVRCELVAGLPIPETVLADAGGQVTETTVEHGRATLRVVVGEEREVQSLVGRVRSTYPDAGVTSVRSSEPDPAEPDPAETDPLETMTDKQRRAVEMAFYNGYFERPREHDTREVAAKLGVTRQTLTQHLRAGQRNLFERLLEGN